MNICRITPGYIVSYINNEFLTVGTFANEFHTWYAKPSRKRYTKSVINETLIYFKR
jgi:hypothetical protein